MKKNAFDMFEKVLCMLAVVAVVVSITSAGVILTHNPPPVIEPLEIGQEYYVADTIDTHPSRPYIWENDEYDTLMLERRIIHLTPKNACAHINAMIIISGGKVD